MPDNTTSTRTAQIARRERLLAIARYLRPKPAPHLRARQNQLSDEHVDELRAFVKANYYHPASYWETPDGRNDLEQHAGGRLAGHRTTYVPWLDSIKPLANLRVLEIGSGTGASTVALAEQGADVTAVEMDEAALSVAKKFCELHGVDVQFVCANAVDACESLNIASYDLIVFFAVLEHMTPLECLASLSSCWNKMKPGALLAPIDTPNRLWPFDAHTAELPFFHWLPAEIAIRYCVASPRSPIFELHKDTSPDGLMKLQRWGRGISFHEFELAVGPVKELQVVSSFGQWRRRHDPPQMLKWLMLDYPDHRSLRRAAKGVPACWLEPQLDLVIRREG